MCCETNALGVLKILSSKVSELARLRYHTYACGKIFRIPLSQAKILQIQDALILKIIGPEVGNI